MVCNVNTVYRNFKSENSQEDPQKPQRNCTFMNSAFGNELKFVGFANKYGCEL